MIVFINIDQEQRITGFSLEPNEHFQRHAQLPDEALEHFTHHAHHYRLSGQVLVLHYDISLEKEAAKARCREKLSLYYDVAFPYTKEERILLNSLREELRIYARDNDMPTPITDSLAMASGVEDKAAFRVQKRSEIQHHDITLAHLIGQKQKMFELIERCEDGEMLQSMVFNFSWPSYSNMRWR